MTVSDYEFMNALLTLEEGRDSDELSEAESTILSGAHSILQDNRDELIE